MPYLAKDFCKMTGLKPDTLRFYVDQGLITPQINPINHYKEYSDLDVLDMYYIRSRCAMNVPITKITQVITRLPPQEQLSWLAEHEQGLIEQRRIIDEQLQRCCKMQKDILNFPHLLGHVIDQGSDEGPDLMQILLVGPNASGENRFELAEAWRQVYPPLLSMIHVPLAELLNESRVHYSVSFGVVVGEKFLFDVPQLKVAPAFRYPSRDCIGTMVKLHHPFALTRNDLQPLFDHAKTNHYTMIDDLASWMITKTHEAGQDWYYFATRVSVRREKI